MDWPELVEWMHSEEIQAVVARYAGPPSEGVPEPESEREQAVAEDNGLER